MNIKSLELSNYRNYESLHIEFDSGTNILCGDNAQGKTNILEAVYQCSTTKSHKGSKDREIIRFGQEEAHIRAYVVRNDIEYKIDMHLRNSRTKGIAINGERIKKAADLLGLINIVFFSPEDLNIIKNGPGERRRFVDLELSQLDKLYLYNLSNYNRIVNQRNKLLKDINRQTDYNTLLDIWDEQLVHYGSKIIERRESFSSELNEMIHDIHLKLSGNKERLQVRYEPNTTKEAFKKALLSGREKDLYRKSTSSGPHRDDLSFFIRQDEQEIDIRKFGSQGQQRTVALSLKLAEIELVKKLVNDSPVLLLDDVLSELDSSRQNYLLNSIGEIQTIITCTGLDDFINNRFHINKIYQVKAGKAYSEN